MAALVGCPDTATDHASPDTDSLLAEFASLKMTIKSSKATVNNVKRVRQLKKILVHIDKELTSAVPDWSAIPSQTATVWKTTLPTSKDDLQNKHAPIQSSSVAIKIAPHPFARGGVRAAYHALVTKESSFQLKPFVVKKYLEPKNRTAEQYLDQLETNQVAKFLAIEFMKTSSGRRAQKIGQQIKFMESYAIQIVDDTTGAVTWYNLEGVIEETFDKWTDNNGFCDPSRENRTLLEFAKWTHEWTNGFMMVSDLQGGKTKKGWTLTDPAMLCQDLSRFGPTNFSEAQLLMCYEGAQHAIRNGLSIANGTPGTSYLPGFSRHDDGSRFAYAHAKHAKARGAGAGKKVREKEQVRGARRAPTVGGAEGRRLALQEKNKKLRAERERKERHEAILLEFGYKKNDVRGTYTPSGYYMNTYAAIIKSVRDKSGAGMMDCKKALEVTCRGSKEDMRGMRGELLGYKPYDVEEAIIWLRKKGIALK